ncbi:MAG: hypothetical protein RML35_11810 [Chloroherpetonaceae bacterium]|nr:hypothetical protein [Chloroherpetonaceae bacterium]
MPTTLTNPCTANGDITVNNALSIPQGVFVLTDAASATRTHSVTGNLTIGSAASSATTASANTALLLNTQNGTTSSLTVGGNFTVDAAATGGVMTALSAISATTTSSALTVNGAFQTAGSSFIRLFRQCANQRQPNAHLQFAWQCNAWQ